MASREELMNSIQPDMRLDKNFFLKVYGYDLKRPGFADQALSKLEIAGCSKARNYYACVMAEWSHEHEKEMKNVAEWYAKEKTNRKVVSEPRRQQEVEQQKNLTRSELTKLCKKLLQEGVIESPEQFATVVDLAL